MAFDFCCRVNGVTFMREFDSIFFIEMSHSICACVARESRYMPRYDTVTLRLNSKRKHYGNGNQIIFHTQYALCTEYTQAVKIYADKKFRCWNKFAFNLFWLIRIDPIACMIFTLMANFDSFLFGSTRPSTWQPFVNSVEAAKCEKVQSTNIHWNIKETMKRHSFAKYTSLNTSLTRRTSWKNQNTFQKNKGSLFCLEMSKYAIFGRK